MPAEAEPGDADKALRFEVYNRMSEAFQIPMSYMIATSDIDPYELTREDGVAVRHGG